MRKRYKVKSLFTVCIFLLLISMLIPSAFAQVVKVKFEAMTPGRFSKTPSPYYISSGIRVVGKGMKVYLSADTTGSGATTATSFAWDFVEKPSGSVTEYSTRTDSIGAAFIADSGRYIVRVNVNSGARLAVDTVWSSTYAGHSATTPGCFCHSANQTSWANTPHAKIFKDGITGNLEVASGQGQYGKTCIKCHTTGWEPATDNGNFGSLAYKSGWDTTWYKQTGYTEITPGSGRFYIPQNDQAAWNQLTGSYSALVQTANIGCESCHGPSGAHKAAFGGTSSERKTAKSLYSGVCNQCHDAPAKHTLGATYNLSNHSTLKTSASESNRAGCWPCHNGSAMVVDAWRHKLWAPAGSKPSSADTAKVDPNFKSISCVSCHDPHGNSNPYQLRYVDVDSLNNGYRITQGGTGQLCMNCHRGRSNVATKIKTTAPYYGFSARFYNHYSPQADMLFGQNGYNYGTTVTGSPSIHLSTTANSCVTCHMSMSNNLPDHEMKMDSAGVKDRVGACTACHSEVTTSFSQKMAAQDYDSDGSTESFLAEIDGLLATLKSKLPQRNGEVIDGPSNAADSAAVANKPQVVQGIWNYWFVKRDFSNGIHNPAYAKDLLKAAINAIPTGVKLIDQNIPGVFALSQNYPNPFNPSTIINFSIPERSNVKIEVYDMVGKRVATLFNGIKEAGSYTIDWNGGNANNQRVASGIYFYRMQAGNFSSVKKMVMLK